MRPISIRFRCFGPYMDEQFLDFTRLEKSGVFLICGETGAGKTTILDAMCYALYGESSGGLRGDMEVMRCKLAGDGDETVAEFIFECNRRVFKFTRSLKKKRKLLHEYHNCMERIDGEFVPIFANPKAKLVNEKAKELLGMDVSQFRQVIVLPQGQFEKLLVSNSEEKEKILKTLFHTDRWQRLAESVAARVARQAEELKTEAQAIGLKLAYHGCGNMEELAAKAAGLLARQPELEQTRELARRTLEELGRQYDRALLENRDFEELTRRQAALDSLLPRKTWAQQEERSLLLAGQARALQPGYLAVCQEEKICREARQTLANARQRADRAGKALEGVEKQYSRHQMTRPDYEAWKQERILLESAGALYESLAELEARCSAAVEQLNREQKNLDRAERDLREAVSSMEQRYEAQNAAMAAYQRGHRLYLLGISGVLAQKLAQGQPCPVCGSLEHPDPAQPGENHITDGELDGLSRTMETAVAAYDRARQHYASAGESKDRALSAFNRAREEEALKRRELDSAMARRLPGIENGEALKTRRRLLTKWIETYESDEERLSRSLSDARTESGAAGAAESEAAARFELVRDGWQNRRESWLGELKQAGIETEQDFTAALLEPREENRRRESLSAYLAALEQARKALAEQQTLVEGREKPNLVALEKSKREAQVRLEESAQIQALAREQLAAIQADAGELEKRQSALSLARLELEADREFSARLSGRSGVSLQRYVLGVMLGSITAGANRLLEHIYGGRYRIYRTDEVAGSARKSGLELEVYDAANNARRSVTTLSGGEKFLVALSLAIGLSAVVQARSGGIRLEAMFVDEGFGSLDKESVTDALEILQSIGRSAGVVGVISHVEQLSEVIPARVEVEKGPRGSSFRILEG